EQRHGFAIARSRVHAQEANPPHRTWGQIADALRVAPLGEQVRRLALGTFERLAVAEGRVHGQPPEQVHFHEVGAHDAIGDIVGVCAGFAWLAEPIRVGPIALGGGTVSSAHGVLAVPGPAVLRLFADSPATCFGGPVSVELCTPTGAALLLTLAESFGALPSGQLTAIGSGCGSRVLPDRLGDVRLLRLAPSAESTEAVVLSTNVDDLDPRLWPEVLQVLLDAGASDAWLTPILMKKGRPAHTLTALAADAEIANRLEELIFRHTSTLGLRRSLVQKSALDRTYCKVQVQGHAITVKLGFLAGRAVTAQPEFADVARVAAALGVPPRQVLAWANEQYAAKSDEGQAIRILPPG
ncbi:MAG: LarC family nickel insertion protein, partial [Angustibacter sp.]